MAKVSVIVPVYNGEKTIKRCLLSIINQPLSDIEIIVVNDGSTDGTLSLVGEVSDSRINVITTENSGQGFARNRGLDAAMGEYIAFVDADDTIETDMLEIMYAAAERANSDVVQCNLYDIYPSGEKRVQLNLTDETVEITDKARYTDRYFTTCRHSYEVCNKLIKKSVIGDLRFGDTRKYFSEDLLFNLELISRIKKITFVSKPLYNYYQSDTSHMHSGGEKRLVGLLALFRDYISTADDEMKKAASHTAAMILSYSAGACAESEAARKMLESEEFKGYIKTALKRECKPSHRLFLKAMRFAPLSVKITICKMYGGRWQ